MVSHITLASDVPQIRALLCSYHSRNALKLHLRLGLSSWAIEQLRHLLALPEGLLRQAILLPPGISLGHGVRLVMVVIMRVPEVPVVIKAARAAPRCPTQAGWGSLARRHTTCMTMPLLEYPISLTLCRSKDLQRGPGCLLIRNRERGHPSNQRGSAS